MSVLKCKHLIQALTDEERERRHNEKMTDEILKNFKGKTFSPEEAMQRSEFDEGLAPYTYLRLVNMIYSSYLGFYNVGMFLAHFYVLCCLVFGYVMYGAGIRIHAARSRR